MSAAPFGPRFESLLGPASFASIIEGMSSAMTILIAGEPGTGKSSVASRVAAAMGGVTLSSGTMVRKAAAASGMTLSEYNTHLARDPGADLDLDARAATAMARGDAVVFESRLAGHLGAWLRTRGRRGLHTVLLRCEPRELSRRLALREGCPELAEAVAHALEHGADALTLAGCVATLSASRRPELRAAASLLADQLVRIRIERERMLDRYGVTVDEAAIYDAVLDTSQLDLAACAQRVLSLADVAR